MLSEVLKAGLAIGEKIEKELHESKQGHKTENPANPLADIFNQLEQLTKGAQGAQHRPEETSAESTTNETQATEKASQTQGKVFVDPAILELLKNDEHIGKVINDLFGAGHVASEKTAETERTEEQSQKSSVDNGVKEFFMNKQALLSSNGLGTQIEEGYYDSRGQKIENPHLNYEVEGYYKATLSVYSGREIIAQLEGHADGKIGIKRVYSTDSLKVLKRAVEKAKQDVSTALLVNLSNEELVNETTKLNRSIFALQEAVSAVERNEAFFNKILFLVR